MKEHRIGVIGIVWVLALMVPAALISGGCGLQPVIDAGPDTTVNENAEVVLAAANRSTADFTDVFWQQLEGPAVTLRNGDSPTASFTAPPVDERTTLLFQVTAFSTLGTVSVPIQGLLEVGGDLTLPAVDSVAVTVVPNPAPYVEAGRDQFVVPGQAVSLSGEGFIDVAGVALTYQWVQLGGVVVALSGANSAAASFVAPDDLGTLVFNLIVEADEGNIAIDALAVTVSDSPASAPLADAGEDQIVEQAAQVTLDAGRSSDPQSGDLSFRWEQVAGSVVSLAAGDGPQAIFAAPGDVDGAAVLLFEVTVTSSAGGLSDTDQVNVIVLASPPQTPTAVITGPASVFEEQEITWSAVNSSDPNAEPLTYLWEIIHDGALGVDLPDPTTPIVTITAPQVAEQAALIVRLTVTNLQGHSNPVTFATTVLEDPAPVADAGLDQFVDEGATVTLDASGSHDPAGSELAYEWDSPPGISSISSATTVKPIFTAPEVAVSKVFSFTLTVTKPNGKSATDTVDVTVRNTN